MPAKAYKNVIAEIKDRSLYLMSKEDYIETIFDRLRAVMPIDTIGIHGVTGTGFDMRGISCNTPPAILDAYINNKPEHIYRFAEQIQSAQKSGYATLALNDAKANFPEIYKLRYEPFGYKCALRSVFMDHSNNLMGLLGALSRTVDRYTEAEVKTFAKLAPYMFYAFKRYRWMLNADFFSVVCFDEFPLGLIAVTASGKITYLNATAKQLFTMTHKTTPKTLNESLTRQLRALNSIPSIASDEPCLIFRDIETYVPPYGGVTCFKYSQTLGGRYLPVNDEGYVIIIDSRVMDRKTKATLSKREIEVLKLLGRGLRDKDIALELGLSERTVHVYVKKLFVKLGTQNRTEAAVKAIKLGVM